MLRSGMAAQHQNTNRGCTRHVTARIRSDHGHIGDQPRLERRFGLTPQPPSNTMFPSGLTPSSPAGTYRGDSIAQTPRSLSRGTSPATSALLSRPTWITCGPHSGSTNPDIRHRRRVLGMTSCAATVATCSSAAVCEADKAATTSRALTGHGGARGPAAGRSLASQQPLPRNAQPRATQQSRLRRPPRAGYAISRLRSISSLWGTLSLGLRPLPCAQTALRPHCRQSDRDRAPAPPPPDSQRG